MRKAKFILPVVACMAVIGMMIMKSPVLEYENLPQKKLMQVETTTLYTTVSCRGTIEDENAREICLSNTAQVTDMFCKLGDSVERGDILFRAKRVTDAQAVAASIGGEASGELEEILENLIETPVNVPVRTVMSFSADTITVRSPISGVLTSLDISQNGLVAAGASCITVSDTESLCVNAQISEELSQDVSEGMECVITGDAFRDESYTGTISQVMPFATTKKSLTGNGKTVVTLIASIDSPDNALRTGYSAKLDIRTQKRENALVVPYEYVDQDDGGEYVFVYSEGCVWKRYVETGLELSNQIEVTDGINKGEYVVSDTTGLEDGMQVRVSEII